KSAYEIFTDWSSDVCSSDLFLPVWFIVVYLLGSIGLGLLFSRVFFRYTDRKRRALALTSGLAAPARIDAIRFGGVRMLETRELIDRKSVVVGREVRAWWSRD